MHKLLEWDVVVVFVASIVDSRASNFQGSAGSEAFFGLTSVCQQLEMACWKETLLHAIFG